MADSIRRMDYFYTRVNDKPGQAARIVEALAADGVGMLAFSGFPGGKKKSQIVFVPEDAKAFKRAAKKMGLKISKTRTGFLLQGEDRIGALGRVLSKLADAKINMTAIDAVAAGSGRYGAILWVKQSKVKKAARAIGAR
jgi:hypothetical protein